MPFNKTLGRLASRAVAGLVAVAALASCGGGTYQVNPFHPARMLSFGDESSQLFGQQGLKYSINGISTATDQVDCSLLPLWNQVLATNYGMVFSNCNPDAVAQPTAISLAQLDADVSHVSDQIDAFLAGDSFNSDDLVTIWVGAHDVIDAYNQNGSGDPAVVLADMHSRGLLLANLINDKISHSGAKLILLTIPDMGLSPFAANENATRGDFDRAALLTQMSDQFNRSLRANVVNDGSKVGLVLVDDFVKSAVRSPSSYGFITDPGLTAGCNDITPLPSCNENTLNTDSGLNRSDYPIWLWADDTHLAAVAHNSIGGSAVSRAQSNPF